MYMHSTSSVQLLAPSQSDRGPRSQHCPVQFCRLRLHLQARAKQESLPILSIIILPPRAAVGIGSVLGHKVEALWRGAQQQGADADPVRAGLAAEQRFQFVAGHVGRRAPVQALGGDLQQGRWDVAVQETEPLQQEAPVRSTRSSSAQLRAAGSGTGMRARAQEWAEAARSTAAGKEPDQAAEGCQQAPCVPQNSTQLLQRHAVPK